MPKHRLQEKAKLLYVSGLQQNALWLKSVGLLLGKLSL